MGFLKLLAIGTSIFIVCLAALMYTPLPEGTQDPMRARILLAPFRLVYLLGKLKEFLGYSTIYSNLTFLQMGPYSGEPKFTAPGVKVTREKIAGVNVLVYRPDTVQDNSPAIVYFHGGGWVIMNADLYGRHVHNYAAETNTVMFSVDYRMAPQHPYPAAVLDCLEVTRYILRQGKEYGIDVKRVGVAGDSAGGNIAAAVALKLTREKSDLPPLKFQILHVPVLQAINLQLPSYVQYSDAMPLLTSTNMCAYFAHYFGFDQASMDRAIKALCENRHIPPELKKSKYAEYVSVKHLPQEYQIPSNSIPKASASYDEEVYAKIKDIITDPLFSPLMADDLTGLPPALIYVAEFDILRDEGLLYAKRLKDSGVSVQELVTKGGLHGDAIKTSPSFMQHRNVEIVLKSAKEFCKKHF